MLCVCGVRCARHVRYVYSFCAEKCQRKRRFLRHFQQRKECTVYFAFFGGLLWSHNGGCICFFSKRIPRGIPFEVYSGPTRSGLISTIASRAEKLTMKNFTKRKLLVYKKGSLKYEDPNDSGYRIN
jgi:hypothetical protein